MPTIDVTKIKKIGGSDLHDLCDAAESAITEGGGFGWLKQPPRHVLESFWRGALLVQDEAQRDGFQVLNLDVRATQTAAIALYEAAGYTRFATHPHYAFVDGVWVEGFYYFKDLQVDA